MKGTIASVSSRLVLAIIALFSFLISSNCLLLSRPHRAGVIDQWETSTTTFKIQVSMFDEKNAVVTGAYYLFESAQDGSNQWREIMQFRNDDQIPIPKDHIRFPSDSAGYLFMGWMYAVTTDSGRTWAVWDATKDLPGWRCCNHGLIEEVKNQQGRHGYHATERHRRTGGRSPRTSDEGLRAALERSVIATSQQMSLWGWQQSIWELPSAATSSSWLRMFGLEYAASRVSLLYPSNFDP